MCRSSQRRDDSLRPLFFLMLVRRTRPAPGLTGLSFTAGLLHGTTAPPDTFVGHQLAQDALAQSAVGHPQPRRRPMRADRLENGAACKHEIGAVGADAGVGDALAEVPADQRLDHPVDLVVVHPQPIDAAAVIALQAEMDAGKRRHRARGAEQVEARSLHQMAQPVASVERVDHAPEHASTIAAKVSRVTSRPPIALGERHHADRQRCP